MVQPEQGVIQQFPAHRAESAHARPVLVPAIEGDHQADRPAFTLHSAGSSEHFGNMAAPDPQGNPGETQGFTPAAEGFMVQPMFRLQTLWEARWIFAVLIVVTVALWTARRRITWIPVLLGALLILFSISFFRDPDRTVPTDPLAVVAAADGVVHDVDVIDEPEVTKGKLRRVGIFLSVFNVHTNRAPIAGKVIYSQEHEGLYLDARDPNASGKNACRTWGFQNGQTTVVVRQLTGLIARRIVGWSQVGDTVAKGERFGMIRFGSRTEIYVPQDAEITVKPGDKVEAGTTVIARLGQP